MKPTRRDVLKLATLMGASHVLGGCTVAAENNPADLILRNGRIATLDDRRSFVQGVAIQDGRFIGAGSDLEIISLRGPNTQIVDLGNKTVIPGLNDSHTHPIRGGLTYNMELRWDGVPSL